MNPLLRCALIPIAGVLAGCANLSNPEVAQMHQRGVPPALVEKMEHGGALTTADIIELSRRRVPDGYIVRAIQNGGVRYAFSRDQLQRLRAAHVDQTVMAALRATSDVAAVREEAGPGVYSSLSPYPESYDFGPYPAYYTYPYQPTFGFGGTPFGHSLER